MKIVDVPYIAFDAYLSFVCCPLFRTYNDVMFDILESKGLVVAHQRKIEFVQNITQS